MCAYISQRFNGRDIGKIVQVCSFSCSLYSALEKWRIYVEVADSDGCTISWCKLYLEILVSCDTRRQHCQCLSSWKSTHTDGTRMLPSTSAQVPLRRRPSLSNADTRWCVANDAFDFRRNPLAPVALITDAVIRRALWKLHYKEPFISILKEYLISLSCSVSEERM